MNVLMVTSDASALIDGSAAQSMLREQATLTNRLMVVVMNGYGTHASPRKVSDNLWIFPTNSWIPFLKILDVLYIVKREFFFQKRLQADIVVANDPGSAGIAGYLLAARYKKPLHVHLEHDLVSLSYLRFSILGAFRTVFARIVAGQATTVSVGQAQTKAAMVRMDPRFADRTTVIPRYIDTKALQSEEAVPADDLHLKYTDFRAIMLVVAPLTHEHNVQLAIRSLAQVSKFYRHIGLVIVGNGPLKLPLKWLAWRLKVADKVIFESMREDLTSYYKSAHLLMVPSRHEEYGTIIEDAAATGCAIVTSPVGIAPALIEHTKNGFLCDPKVPSEFWNAADALIRNWRLWDEVKKNILISVETYMHQDKSEHLALYKASWESAIRLARGVQI
ncbi:glycosyltransferase [Candidatus Kaiserbacteria bacterium]|nr:glycosyltransferase [Candidatus Kaiserbacteria bacterium]